MSQQPGEKVAGAPVTEQHMHLLAWLRDHEGAGLEAAATALGTPLLDVERLVGELVQHGLLERHPRQ